MEIRHRLNTTHRPGQSAHLQRAEGAENRHRIAMNSARCYFYGRSYSSLPEPSSIQNVRKIAYVIATRASTSTHHCHAGVNRVRPYAYRTAARARGYIGAVILT